MGRKEQREAARKETNAVAGLCKIQRKYIPNLFDWFADTEDPRNPCYIKYSNRMMPDQMYFKGISGITSMQEMTEDFNDKKVSRNLSQMMGCEKRKYLPHHVTENEYLERLAPEEIEEVNYRMVYHLIRSKRFYKARYKKRWIIIVDGTQIYSGDRRINEGCLERHFEKGTEKRIHKLPFGCS